MSSCTLWAWAINSHFNLDQTWIEQRRRPSGCITMAPCGRRRGAQSAQLLDLSQYLFPESVMGSTCRLLSRRPWGIVSLGASGGATDDGKPVGASLCSGSGTADLLHGDLADAGSAGGGSCGPCEPGPVAEPGKFGSACSRSVVGGGRLPAPPWALLQEHVRHVLSADAPSARGIRGHSAGILDFPAVVRGYFAAHPAWQRPSHTAPSRSLTVLQPACSPLFRPGTRLSLAVPH